MGRYTNKGLALSGLSAVIGVFTFFGHSQVADAITCWRKGEELAALKIQSASQGNAHTVTVLFSVSPASTPNTYDSISSYYGNLGGPNSSADSNGDAAANFIDYAIFANAWWTTFDDLTYNEQCDFADDNFIDYKDLSRLCDDWLNPQYPMKVAVWQLDEGSGQIAHDQTANNNDGTLGSSADIDEYDPTWIPGRIGKGLEFQKDNTYSHHTCHGTYVQVPDNSSLNVTNAITLCGWFEPYSDDRTSVIITKTYGTGGSSKIRYRLGMTINKEAYAQLYIGGACAQSLGTAHDDGFLNKWHHFAATFDGSTMILYVDGSEDAREENLSGTLSGGDGHVLMIGHGYKDPSRCWYTPQGAIDDVRVYDGALAASEIKALYIAGSEGAPFISSISPNEALPGTSVTISGSNFGTIQSLSKVYFWPMVEATVTSWSDMSITCEVPDGLPTYELNKVRVVTRLGSNGIWFNAVEPLKWGFEAGTEYWTPRAQYDLGCTGVTQSSAYYTEGSCSLGMQMDLQTEVGNKGSGEAFVLYPCGDLDGKKIAVDIYCPTGAGGTPSAYNGLQVFVKDSEYRCEYGRWINISQERTWYTIYLTVDGASDGSGGVV
ncbi:MAG: IPT/TIG domain-containing protein, partial [Dehalococcoidia bacterium]